MHIYLVDSNKNLVAAWNEAFISIADVSVSQGDATKVECDAIVSPANSFGFMDGGVDQAITNRFGSDLQKRLQDEIKTLPEQELLVGRALVIPTEDKTIPYLISAPTMRVPMDVSGTINPYLAMKAALIAANNHSEINSIVIPGLGTGCGCMPYRRAAIQMRQALDEVLFSNSSSYKSLSEACNAHLSLARR